MCDYEFVDIHTINIRVCVFYDEIVRILEKNTKIRNVNGKVKHSVGVCGNELMSYQIGKKSNIYDWSYYRHRHINDVEYAEDYPYTCKRMYKICNCSNICEQLNTIQAHISRADSVIDVICAADNIETRTIMRPINARLNVLTIEFDASGMIPVANNPYY